MARKNKEKTDLENAAVLPDTKGDNGVENEKGVTVVDTTVLGDGQGKQHDSGEGRK